MAKLFVSDLVNTDDAVFLLRKLVVEVKVVLLVPLVVLLLEELQKSKSLKISQTDELSGGKERKKSFEGTKRMNYQMNYNQLND